MFVKRKQFVCYFHDFTLSRILHRRYVELGVCSAMVKSPLQMAIKGVSFRQNTTMYLNYCIFYYCIQVTSFF